MDSGKEKEESKDGPFVEGLLKALGLGTGFLLTAAGGFVLLKKARSWFDQEAEEDEDEDEDSEEEEDEDDEEDDGKVVSIDRT